MSLLKKRATKTKNIKKFRNKKFNLNNFVEEYYMEQNTAYITVKVDNYNDIVSKYSVDCLEWINSDFANYLEEVAYYIPVDEPIVIEITGTKFSEEEKKTIEKVIKTYFGLKLGDKMLDLNINRTKSLTLFILGIMASLIFWVLYKFHVIETVTEIILLGFWFFMWEFLDLAFLVRNEIKVQKLEAGQLSSASIVFLD